VNSFRPTLKIIALIAVYTLIPILLFDGALRFWIHHLPMNLKNLLLSRYEAGPDGIYFHDPRWDMHLMKPGYDAEMFYNGYRWHHHANKQGIRSETDFQRADVVLLGDSQVYGHGLQERETIASRLEALDGLKTANLGVQGDYPPFSYIRLRELGLFYQPEVVLFFTALDQDLEDYRTRKPGRDDLEAILAAPAQDYAAGFRACRYLEGYQQRWGDTLSSPWRNMVPTLRILHFARAFARWRLAAPASGEGGISGAGKDPYSDAFLFEFFSHFLQAADTLCRQHHCRLVLVIHPEGNKSLKLKESVLAFARDKGIEALDLETAFSMAPDRGKLFLKGDGHYSAQGAAYVAETVNNFLQGQGDVLPQTPVEQGSLR